MCEGQNVGIELLNVVQDLSLLTADRDGALYVLAQDPDGDRFAAAEKWYDPLSPRIYLR